MWIAIVVTKARSTSGVLYHHAESREGTSEASLLKMGSDLVGCRQRVFFGSVERFGWLKHPRQDLTRRSMSAASGPLKPFAGFPIAALTPSPSR